MSSPLTCYLPHFPKALQGSAPKSGASVAAAALAKLKAHAMPDLQALFGRYLSEDFFAKSWGQSSDSKPKLKRNRIYTQATVFWGFMYQVLNPGMACQGVVARLSAWLKHRASPKHVASSTAAYCEARSALPLEMLSTAFAQMRDHLLARAPEAWSFHGRDVRVMDGSSVSMPDTPELQRKWPQPKAQAKGCGFPVAKLLGLFCLATGAWIGHALGGCYAHDMSLWPMLRALLKRGDILVADSGFCSWALMMQLQQGGIDTVVRLHQARSKDMRRGKALGPHDRLQRWSKPRAPSPGWTKQQWESLPDELAVRVLHVRVARKGFRTTELWLATTLQDTALYSFEQVAELYYRRWSIELFFRDLKTTLRMEVLRCKSPANVEKEIYMHAIVYNALRTLILQSAQQHGVELGRVGFKGALDTLVQGLPEIARVATQARKLEQARWTLWESIASICNDARPDRREPRAKKRRPKPYALLTKPRRKFKEIPHREKYRAAA